MLISLVGLLFLNSGWFLLELFWLICLVLVFRFSM